MNRKFLVPLIAVFGAVTVFASCMKDNTPSCQNLPYDQEKTAINNHLANQGITGGEWTNQGYYSITNIEGEGEGIQPTDSVVVFNKIQLLDGTEVGKDTLRDNRGYTTLPYNLVSQDPSSNLFMAINKLKAGGETAQYLPSSLAWGCNGAKDQAGAVVVPPNTQVISTYTLLNIVPAKSSTK